METEIQLIYSTWSPGDSGKQIQQEHAVEVFAQENSTSSLEFYRAAAAGMEVTKVWTIRSEDYEMVKHTLGKKIKYAETIEVDGCRYDVVRDYWLSNGKVVISCK